MHACINAITLQFGTVIQWTIPYSVLGKCPWALKHTSQFWPVWALTRDQNSVHLYRAATVAPVVHAYLPGTLWYVDITQTKFQ